MSVSERDRRICETAISVLDGVPSKRLNVVVLNKALFYADLVALRDLGETLTGSRYLALPMGPTIEGYERHLVKPLVRLGWAEQIELGLAKPLRKIATPDEMLFLERRHADLARLVGNRFQTLTSSQASDLSHENLGWKVARERGLEAGGKGMAINMVLAMQQLDMDDDAEWLVAPLTEAERAAIEADVSPVPFA